LIVFITVAEPFPPLIFPESAMSHNIPVLFVQECTYNFHDDFIREMYDEAEVMVRQKNAAYDQTH